MSPTDQDNLRITAPILAGLGVAVLLAGIFADDLGIGGMPGFYRRETALTAAGGVILLAGLALFAPALRTRVGAWLERWFARTAVLGVGPSLRVAAWLGLVTGFAEVIQQGVMKYGFGYILKLSEHLVWVAPLTYFALFPLLALLLRPLLAVSRGGVPMPLLVLPLTVLAVWTQCVLQPRLANWAMTIVIAAIAFQITAATARRPDGFLQLCRRTTPWLLGLVLLGALAVPGLRAVRGWQVTADQPAARDGAPNVLVIVLDTVRADHLDSYGYDRETMPVLKQFAEQAALFEWPISTSPWTLPSHSTLFTGHYRHTSRASWLRALDDSHPTLPEEFTAQGYATVGFVGNVVYCLRENGVDRGFAEYEDFYLRPGVFANSSNLGRYCTSRLLGPNALELSRNNAEVVTTHFFDWLDDRDDRPFFAFLNYFDAHAPYLPPDGYATAFGPKSDLVLNRFGRIDFTPEEMQGFVDAYDGGLLFIDHWLGKLFTRLRDDGLLDDTVIVIVGDHGEHFGEHGLMDHGSSLYGPLIYVPLIVSYPPRMPAGARIPDIVSTRDVAATILDLADLEPRTPIPGQSLAPLWESPEPPPGFALSPALSEVSKGIRTPAHEPVSRGDMISIVEDGLHLILNGDGSRELYDIRRHPRELGVHNLIDTEPGAEFADRVGPAIRQWVETEKAKLPPRER